MAQQPQIDYDAIAAEVRGDVDYDAIFAEVSAPPVTSPAPAKPSLLRQFGNQLQENVMTNVDAVKGATAGLMSTAYHGGDIIRRVLGMERVIDTPEAQAAMTPPSSWGGKIGFYGEQAGEFLVPGARVSKAVAKSGMAARMLAEGAMGAGVTAVQSGADPTMTGVGAVLGAAMPPVGKAAVATGKMIQRAASGAQEGGFGGAVAGAIRNVAPAAPKAMITQGIKPRATNTKFMESLDTSLPELKAVEAEIGKPIESVEDLLTAIPAAKQKLRALWDQMSGPAAARGTTVDLSPVSRAIAGSVPSRTRLLSPQKADDMLQQAAAYANRFPLHEAEQLLKEVNAELNSFYAQYPTAQRRALASNPIAAGMEAEAKALRDAIYSTLDDPGQGAAAREVNRRYGAILRLEEETWRRFNVAARQQPEGLSEQFANARAASDIVRGAWKLAHGNPAGAMDIAAGAAGRAAAKFAKEQQTTDALIRRAFKLIKDPPAPINIPPQPQVRGLLNRGPVPMGPVPDPSGVSASRAPVMDYDANGRPIYSSDPTAPNAPQPPIDATFVPKGAVPERPSRGPAPDYTDAEFTEAPPPQLGAGTQAVRRAPKALGPGPDVPPIASPPPTGPRPLGPGPSPRGFFGRPSEQAASPVTEAPPTPAVSAEPSTSRPAMTLQSIRGPVSPGDRLSFDGGEGVVIKADGPVALVRMDVGGGKTVEKVVELKDAAISAPDTSAPKRPGSGGQSLTQRRAAAERLERESAPPPAISRPAPKVTPQAPAAKATVEPAAKAPAQAPATAAKKVEQQIDRVIDLKGTTSGAHVRSRIVDALVQEAEKAKTAFGEIDVVPGTGRAFDITVGGEPVINVNSQGVMQVAYGASDEMIDALGVLPQKSDKYGTKISLGGVPGRPNDLTKADLYTRAKLHISKRLSGKGAQTVTIQIPGDGTFTLERNPVAIREAIRRITKSEVSAWANLSERATSKKAPR